MRDPKSLTEWLELDYFRRQRRLRRVRRQVTWAILLLSAVILAVMYWWGNRDIYQAGPLAPAHTMFNDNCALCHTEAFRTARRILPANADLRTVLDEACQRCHEGAVHNEQETADPSCASCHREHRGALVLARVTDDHCTACHAELRRKDGTAPQFLDVSGFPGGHPEFKLWRSEQPPRDPGVLRFNHHVHLREGGVLGPDGKPVALDCTTCHVPDSERRYMKPINYEQHCAQCHPLGVPLSGGWEDAEARAAAEAFRRRPAPHEAPETVRATLRERYSRFFATHPPGPVQEVPPERRLPGRREEQPAAAGSGAWVEQQLRDADRVLFAGAGGCRYCHEVETPWTPRQLPAYVRPRLPERWFRHGVFGHDSHRMLTCTECHPGVAQSKQTADVLMPKMESCQACHNSREGARTDCVECHRYHDRSKERSLSGPHTIAGSLGLPDPPKDRGP